jgi:hypothetical protein
VLLLADGAVAVGDKVTVEIEFASANATLPSGGLAASGTQAGAAGAIRTEEVL